jgi:hypothetical protein
MAKFDKAYVEFLQGKAEKDAPRSFMRMHLFGTKANSLRFSSELASLGLGSVFSVPEQR